MHDRLDRLESRKSKLGDLERKMDTIELAQNDVLDVPRANDSVKRQNALLKERVDALERKIEGLQNTIE